jgi:hypothetical protein
MIQEDLRSLKMIQDDWRSFKMIQDDLTIYLTYFNIRFKLDLRWYSTI